MPYGKLDDVDDDEVRYRAVSARDGRFDGWFFVGRPTVEELRHDLRAIMESNANYAYEAFDTPRAKSIRIPQQEWLDGTPTLGANGLPVASGVVKTFDRVMTIL